MSYPGWSEAVSPFHPGELAIQERLGVRERMDAQGRRVIRTYLTEQHRQFYPQLPFLVVGSVSPTGQIWASLLTGVPGFISSPDAHTLRVEATPPVGDPLAQILAEGLPLGLLGIELHTRRRNRLNGTVTALDSRGFTLSVGQSFGNCPMFIQARQFALTEAVHTPGLPRPIHPLTALTPAERALIAGADTLFIASTYLEAGAGGGRGADVSHRGGKPGFVHIADDRTLVLPDFNGNHHFNTVGNLLLNPRAGLLFVDFARGDLLYLSGKAEVIWDAAAVSAYAGAERLIRFALESGVRVSGSLPLRWSAPQPSPFLESTGSWESSR